MEKERENKWEREIRFVARRYREGALDPGRAWERFAAARGIRRGVAFRRYWAGVAAAVLALVGLGVWLAVERTAPRWVAVSAEPGQAKEWYLPDNTHVTLAGGARRMTIRRFDLIMVDANSFIIVVMTDTNVVKNKLVRLPSDLSEPQLQLLTTLLNTSFVGKTLDQLTPELMRVAEHAAGNSYGLISLVVSFAMEVLEELGHSSVYTAGASHILDHPEYQDVGKAQKLMTYLSDEPDLVKALSLPAMQDDNTKILIGPENVADELKDTSVVLASYDIGDGMKGVIGVVGPTRMDYGKVAAKLSYVADGLSKLFGQTELPPGKPEKEE